MKKEIWKHKLAYFILILGLGIFIFAFFSLWPNRSAQRISVIVMSVLYFTWGVCTHVKTDTISQRVVAEYASISTLAGLLLIFITL